MKKKVLKTLKPGTLLLMVRKGSYDADCRKGDIVTFMGLGWDSGDLRVICEPDGIEYSQLIHRKDVELYEENNND